MNVSIKRYPFLGNEKILIEYWANHISDWKMDEKSILLFSKDAAEHLWLYIAYKDGECCGVLVNEEGESSALWLFHTVKKYRNNGIGGMLFDKAFKNVGHKWVAGHGSGYWWQGVPSGCGDQFLEKRGFQWSWTSIDMAMSLNGWQKSEPKPPIIIGKLMPHESNDFISLLKSEDELSGWTEYYTNMIDDSAFNHIIVARFNQMIVGCAMVLTEEDIRWRDMIKGKVGGVGCLGVMKKYRQHGIGASLVYAVNEELKNQGYTHSYIGYTWLEEWYGKMGYVVFNRQRMGYIEWK
ncbi:GNAT family N-acetyltransferase [Bacillus sp. FJAT-49711]|uniref:GNAT family N-acetyltransferase n=1 Tax=Bacillus sp. FJAT-49711 TaxID=2833585 RepID=UPI001BC8E753|nr:GNAT family N-acetyltransferase [Bacillus sp. FJAT-49711]MBS4220155.1 GNAT family N-acetyltransferase [Bacillus sp. FJAT-49711]